MLNLGVHVSIADNIYKSVERAAELGCNTMQIFSRNPRQWRKTPLEDSDIKVFRELVEKFKIKPVVIHIPYTLNLAAVKRSFYKITIRDFIADLIEADKLGADYLVTHMGSHKGSTDEAGLLRIANALNKILKETQGIKTMILLENTAGSGKWLGYKFSHHRFILDKLNQPYAIGACLDTAHAWAAGYAIDNPLGLETLINEIKREIGLERLKLIHLNDTQVDLGSLKDRHFAIGEGKIGKKGFSLILNHPHLRDLPFILETPKEEDNSDIINLSMVRNLYKNEVHKRS
ncbi:MAG: deoxyribonuclease IV [Candidatus Omnitrophica bacterium]|jgi:deoxyribonuclease-4|nr:deoxyribonuclease IV [Candidatus Omnitrophota bacterium]